ncbi:MAG: 2-isopropylmalate synthase [Candidatus Margulisiibacteriota bacterium]|nr:MAG: 2-isopropylmalate synthase [Candidatus Margulisbacteria bacterium GWD2_39_127]OGI05293.1 MAG: 2-isopropylmalate synthase [Candidatus Margulisbacteria bacterium GWF2_38_17]OGI10848.1 MAG: 2-isopropylmalate synthase [Candidatus Margulisbacteria bacterium GWE2_39_32]PZM83534.1 MAG: 2-isopropylmalate synthase [Candidatus Margulisiibacteriota bacterium]HAR64288.1 2-isopropylmalate synthase [Candidatus Margulisiibacteriota bacterium]
MNKDFLKKYRPYPKIDIPDRTWPNNSITKAPIWCSVDLRDGNQALVTPMSLEEKLEFFQTLVNTGFKEIEVGFPSSAQVEFDFLRKLITENLIPTDVRVQVLVQARRHLIEKTFEALAGSKKSILHLYNSTSTNQRKIVFQKSKQEIIDIAVQGVNWVKEFSQKTNTPVTLEYSAESFTGTEIDYALEICNAVINEWAPTPENKIIINLPATMELASPNYYADMIEWMSRRLNKRDCVILSLHTHNDRGTAIAASELGILAGADRVEGTLFGNGERTGNADVITLALNLFTQGIDPELDFYTINNIITAAEKYNKIPVHVRHPYAGDLVYTAFSGSHQDAIKKGIEYQNKKDDPYWEVPYLPIDPADLGRSYEGIIRINSQSGKGGVAYILEKEFGYQLPKDMHPEFAKVVQAIADGTGKEVNNQDIYAAFENEYIKRKTPISFVSFDILSHQNKQLTCKLTIEVNAERKELTGIGNGPVDACKDALASIKELVQFNINEYYEHALKKGSTSEAIAYIEIENPSTFSKYFGVGIDTDIMQAAIKSMISALNRSMK